MILCHQLGAPYYPERCPKKETFLVKAPFVWTVSKACTILDCQANVADLRREYDRPGNRSNSSMKGHSFRRVQSR
jgi:hypothetical protein